MNYIILASESLEKQLKKYGKVEKTGKWYLWGPVYSLETEGNKEEDFLKDMWKTPEVIDILRLSRVTNFEIKENPATPYLEKNGGEKE